MCEDDITLAPINKGKERLLYMGKNGPWGPSAGTQLGTETSDPFAGGSASQAGRMAVLRKPQVLRSPLFHDFTLCSLSPH